MSEDGNFSADVEGLRSAGINITRWSTLARNIADRVHAATVRYQNAGGTGGDMTKSFNANYRPGEQKALEFLRLLDIEIGGLGSRTIEVAQTFEQTNDDANQATPKT
ncbi:hypothetical protein [Actinophytocola xanthii]|uniref:WXG100 family type VII secretion target n=1 Tax=Actinophytocola xanthii TaxID=1912961 RepID=A0A1Q8CTF1_9PSEU|nr:hypothetical protein [Actinophytocola xanthii]OLF17638.1 hypothetical protein BU204_10500 [Actinophytocola xanthii]